MWMHLGSTEALKCRLLAGLMASKEKRTRKLEVQVQHTALCEGPGSPPGLTKGTMLLDVENVLTLRSVENADAAYADISQAKVERLKQQRKRSEQRLSRRLTDRKNHRRNERRVSCPCNPGSRGWRRRRKNRKKEQRLSQRRQSWRVQTH